ncbi:hypothetical protein VY345_002700 [Enterococcus faecalis]|nr:hypothetical protein [Enterococcus faecalis]
MVEINRTNDEIYKAVSSFYKNKRLSKDAFIRRLKYIRSILDGDETVGEIVGWIFTLEEIEFYATSSDDEVNAAKRKIREEIKGILELLDIKVSRNQLIDEKDVE